MNEQTKKGVIIFIGAIVISLIIGAAGAGIIAYRIYRGRSPGDVDQLIARYDQLDRDYEQRLSAIRENQNLIANGIDKCLGYVEEAGNIISRSRENSSRAISNLTEAVRLIRQGIEERQALENQLNNINTGLHDLRNANWQGDL